MGQHHQHHHQRHRAGWLAGRLALRMPLLQHSPVPATTCCPDPTWREAGVWICRQFGGHGADGLDVLLEGSKATVLHHTPEAGVVAVSTAATGQQQLLVPPALLQLLRLWQRPP